MKRTTSDGYMPEKKAKRNTYIVNLDHYDKKQDKYHMSHSTRKMYEHEAAPLIKSGHIRPQTERDTAPRRIVNLDGKEMSWGAYLKLKNAGKKQ